MAMYDDQAVYFAGLVDFLHSLQGSEALIFKHL